MHPLLLVGAGGFGREVAEVVRSINEERPTWELLGFLDDGLQVPGPAVDGIPVLGSCTLIERYPQAQVVVCTGHPGNYFSRKRLVCRLDLPRWRFATLIHPSAVVPVAAEIGPGTVLLANVVATTRVRVGAHVAVMPGVVLTHDDVVGDYVTIGSGARLAGGVEVSDGAYLGSGALIRENLKVGPWALVGMGAVVVDQVPGGQVWAGVPARRLRRLEIPEDVAAAS